MYVNGMKWTGVRLSLEDYRDLSAINRDDIVLWNQAEKQRNEDEAELRRREVERNG